MILEQHENKYYHVPKIPIRVLGIITYLIIAYGSWGYIFHKLDNSYPEGSLLLIFSMVVLFFVILSPLAISAEYKRNV